MQNPGEMEFVTVTIGGQMFGLPIGRVHDVFAADNLARVPMAPPEIAGVLNLRGRIVTAIDMRRLLDLPPRPEQSEQMAVGIEYRGESYGLLIDEVGEVLKFPAAQQDAVPINLDPRWGRIAAGVLRLDGKLMIVLDVDRVLDVRPAEAAA
jgi:purine-binding chemotaxis protein CheW